MFATICYILSFVFFSMMFFFGFGYFIPAAVFLALAATD
jgi:hypothetical protein